VSSVAKYKESRTQRRYIQPCYSPLKRHKPTQLCCKGIIKVSPSTKIFHSAKAYIPPLGRSPCEITRIVHTGVEKDREFVALEFGIRVRQRLIVSLSL